MNKKTLGTWQDTALSEIKEVAPYYMEYMRDAVVCTLQWDYSLRDLASMWVQVYEEVVMTESDKKDELYENGSYGRPWIMDGWPKEKELFYPEAQKCRKVLQGYGFPKISDL